MRAVSTTRSRVMRDRSDVPGGGDSFWEITVLRRMRGSRHLLQCRPRLGHRVLPSPGILWTSFSQHVVPEGAPASGRSQRGRSLNVSLGPEEFHTATFQIARAG